MTPYRVTVATIQDVGHAYTADNWIFRHCTANVVRGLTLSILGPNGCGKTTLIKILLSSLRPTEGSVFVDGRVAFVPQLFSVEFDYTVLDMVLMGRARNIAMFSQPSRADESSALDVLDRFGMAGFSDEPFHQLSGGQRQLVILARALVADAEVLILDEPTSALDLQNQTLVLKWIRKLSEEQGITVIFTTHQANHALAIADKTLLMLRNTPAIFGPVRDVLTEENLSRLYHVPIRRLKFEHDGTSGEAIVPVLRRD